MGDCQSIQNLNCRGQPITPNSQTTRQRSLSQSIKWDGSHFIIPQTILFERLGTYDKVQRAATQFCQQSNISLYYRPMLSRVIAYRQQNMFLSVWNQLEQNKRMQFLEDMNSIEHDLMDSFYHQFLKNRQEKSSIRKAMLAMPRITRKSMIPAKDQNQLMQIGIDLLRQNKAVVLMCAGSSVRFGSSDKFLFPIRLFFQTTTLLDLFFMRMRKNTTSNTSLPIIINCNEYNVDIIQSYLRRKSYFGYNSNKIKYCITYSLAVFDGKGKYCVNGEMKLIKRPGGTAAAAENVLNRDISGFLKQERVQFLYCFGMENLLENPCDPLFLGMVKSQRRKLGVKCTNSLFLGQKLARYYRNPFLQKVQLLSQQNIRNVQQSPILSDLPVALNTVIFRLQSLTAIIQDYNNTLFLAQKYHVCRKKQKVYNAKIHKIDSRDCYSFQKDLRDIISCIEDPLLLMVERNQEYAPIISKSNQYALDAAVGYFQKRIEQQIAMR